MKATRFSLTIEVKRSREFQSATAAATVEYELEEGEDLMAQMRAARSDVYPFVRNSAAGNLKESVEAARQDVR